MLRLPSDKFPVCESSPLRPQPIQCTVLIVVALATTVVPFGVIG